MKKKQATSVTPDNYFRVANHFIHFMWNFPQDFLNAFGPTGTHLRDHMNKKFELAYEKAGTKYCMLEFYSDLDGTNRKKLTDWARENYTGNNF
jgi:hypothetical protein